MVECPVYGAVLNYTVQYTALYSTAQHCTMQHSTALYYAVQYSSIQYSTLLFNAVLCHTVQYYAVQYSLYCIVPPYTVHLLHYYSALCIAMPIAVLYIIVLSTVAHGALYIQIKCETWLWFVQGFWTHLESPTLLHQPIEQNPLHQKRKHHFMRNHKRRQQQRRNQTSQEIRHKRRRRRLNWNRFCTTKNEIWIKFGNYLCYKKWNLMLSCKVKKIEDAEHFLKVYNVHISVSFSTVYANISLHYCTLLCYCNTLPYSIPDTVTPLRLCKHILRLEIGLLQFDVFPQVRPGNLIVSKLS